MIAPANTGTASKSKITVIKIDHANKGIWSQVSPGVRILTVVVIKLIAPMIEDAPAR